jgi:hypothetical protein
MVTIFIFDKPAIAQMLPQELNAKKVLRCAQNVK